MKLNIARLIGAPAVALLVSSVPGLASSGEQAERVQVYSLSGAYLAARTAESDNDLNAAVDYYRRALLFDPDNQALQQSLLLGLVSIDAFDEALPFAEKLREVPEVERFSRLALAVDAIRQNRFGEAETLLKLALESDLDRLITNLMTGWVKLGSNDPVGAIAHLEKLAGPGWYDLFVDYHIALVAERAGKPELARERFTKVTGNVAAGGAAPEAYLRSVEAYAGFLVRAGDRDEALELLAKAEEFAPGRLTLAALREKIDRNEDVPLLVPGPAAGAAEVLLNLATALNRSGGESFVRLYLHFANALLPGNDAILIQLAGIAEQQEDAETAIRHYSAIPADSPLKRVAELQLGLNLADMERDEEAIEHLKAALDEAPDDMRAYLALGGVYSSQENFEAAANLYDKAVERIETPTRAEWNIFYQRGIAYERLKQWEKAEPNFFKALELFPDQPQVLNYLGYSWVDMNIRLDEGLEFIQRAVDLRPSDGYIVDSLGWAFYRLNRFEDAVRELERAVGLMPNDPVLNDHLGDAYWRVGRRLEATFQWNHAKAMDPDPKVLADVERKLAEGLPPVEDRAEATPVAEHEEAALAPSMAPEPQQPAAAEVTAEPTTAREALHVVTPGQTLWSIAAETLGDGNRFGEILELNPDLRGDPARLAPGQQLRLPAK